MTRWLSGLALGLAALAAPAWAQIATPAASNSGVYYSADSAEVINSQCLKILRGSAEVVQDQSRLRANTITLSGHAKPKPAGASTAPAAAATPGASAATGDADCTTDKIDADGEVYYVTPQQTAHGNHAVYDAVAGQIIMTGNVVVVQGKDVVTGERLTIEVQSHRAHMDAAGAASGRPRRVIGVFYPSQGGLAGPGLSPGPATPAAAAPAPPAPATPAGRGG